MALLQMLKHCKEDVCLFVSSHCFPHSGFNRRKPLGSPQHGPMVQPHGFQKATSCCFSFFLPPSYFALLYTCRMRAMQAELGLLRQQIDMQQSKLDQASQEAEAALGRRELLNQTIEPLRQELDKLHVLMTGLSEV